MHPADSMIAQELKIQQEQWGLEHDIQAHGSEGLVEAAGIIAGRDRPHTTEYQDGPYDEDQWFIQLWHKHKDNPARRYAIAAAMLNSAIACYVYEQGLDSLTK